MSSHFSAWGLSTSFQEIQGATTSALGLVSCTASPSVQGRIEKEHVFKCTAFQLFPPAIPKKKKMPWTRYCKQEEEDLHKLLCFCASWGNPQQLICRWMSGNHLNIPTGDLPDLREIPVIYAAQAPPSLLQPLVQGRCWVGRWGRANTAFEVWAAAFKRDLG